METIIFKDFNTSFFFHKSNNRWVTPVVTPHSVQAKYILIMIINWLEYYSEHQVLIIKLT
jgi:hypothetical protein